MPAKLKCLNVNENFLKIISDLYQKGSRAIGIGHSCNEFLDAKEKYDKAVS